MKEAVVRLLRELDIDAVVFWVCIAACTIVWNMS